MNKNTTRHNYTICIKCNKLFDKNEHQDGCPACRWVSRSPNVDEPLHLLHSVCDWADDSCLDAICSTCCFEAETVNELAEQINELMVDELRVCPYCEVNEKTRDEVRCPSCHKAYLVELGMVVNPEYVEVPEMSIQDSSYFVDARGTEKPSGQLSRDDQNRRLRESKLGFAAPSDDWANAGEVVTCIFDGQQPTIEKVLDLVENMGIKQINNRETNTVAKWPAK